MKENRSFARTVRMKESVRAYIEKQPGESFSDKFENMVKYSMERERELKKAIAHAERQLATINQDIRDRQNLKNRLGQIDRYLSSVHELCKQLQSKIRFTLQRPNHMLV